MGLGGITETGVGVISTEDEKRRERGHAVALFRYQLICPALDKDLSTKARGRLVREIAAKEHVDPFGTSVRYSRDTLDRWIRRYRAGGFVELIPSTRALSPRTDAATLELAAALKRENPARTAAQVARILRASAGWAPSESTLLRLFHRCELIGPAAGDRRPAVCKKMACPARAHPQTSTPRALTILRSARGSPTAAWDSDRTPAREIAFMLAGAAVFGDCLGCGTGNKQTLETPH